MSERNKALVRRTFADVYTGGDLDAVDVLVSTDFIAHVGFAEIHGPGQMKQYVVAMRGAFPDLHVTVDDQVSEGNKVVTRWTARGTHAGAFQGVAPTGTRISMSGIDIDQIVDARVVECWSIVDQLGLMQQLGVIPQPEHATL